MRRLLPLLTAAALAGCGSEAPAAPPAGDAPAAAVSLSVTAAPAGHWLHRLVGTAEPDSETMALAYDRSTDGGETWSAPVAVAAAADAPPIKKVSRGEDAQLAVSGDGRVLLAVWPARGTGVWGSGPLGSAVSRDGGATWAPAGDPAPFPADDPVAEHGARFPALTPLPDGAFGLAWIDASDEARGVRHNRFDPASGSWTQPVTVDATSCACCWNALAVVGDEEVFVYRDAKPSDMAAARRPLGGAAWSGPTHVVPFGWDFDGCPHVGAGLAAEPDGGRLFAAVWTGEEGAAGLHGSFSDDAGASWSAPVRLGGDGATHPSVAALGGGRVAAAWTSNAAGSTTLQWAVSHDRGATWSQPVAFAGGGDALPSHALLVASRGRLRAQWTEQNGDAPAAVASVGLEVDP